MKDYIFPQKADLKPIILSELNLTVPDLKSNDEAKSIIIAKWMMKWIDEKLGSGSISVGALLPSKPELAYFLGVSVGTIQNSLRYIEDFNYVESKQRIGTIIKDRNSDTAGVRKLTSKREIAIKKIKKFIISNKIKKDEFLPSSRALSELINCSANTTRLALEYLCTVNILAHSSKSSADNGWRVVSVDFSASFSSSDMEQKTLVTKIEKDLKDYIDANLHIGDKLPAHSELSDMFKVSIKTVHDALKALIDDGILLARRGRYGTTVIRLPKDNLAYKKLEKSIFAPAQDAAFYYYEKTQNAIKEMIANNYEIGSKLPSIVELSREMDLSPNTIRKAFHNLAKEGYLVFSRGRYGGTFVVDIPQTGEETFKWLAVNPQYAKTYSQTN
ncbi:GntR family transcriptional regulator [bacterium]|nr:GntR family transcriptional regulator [bacterium]